MVSSKKNNKWCLQKKKKIEHKEKLLGLRRSRVCILSYSTTVDMTGYLFIFYLYSFFVFCILYYFFFFFFFFLFEDTIEKFRLLISKIYTQLTWNLPVTYPTI